MMQLNKDNLDKISQDNGLQSQAHVSFQLPEKVLQFGTGVLLRALPDFIIDQANKKNVFNGRIVMVKSTATGNIESLRNQDGLYTVCVRGINRGAEVINNHMVSSVSRVLSASHEWNKVLELAAAPELKIIISNTTEVGIIFTADNIYADPPQSFPGKLLAFLYRRFQIFKGGPSSGLVIIPTELIPANADKLLAILIQLAHQHKLEQGFINWLTSENYFCNSLVDRIVPGKPSLVKKEKMEHVLGYIDEEMIICESYALWAIESNDSIVKEIISFALNVEGVVLAPDITKFRELKLRLLNGAHTFCCGIAYLAGFKTVKDAMADQYFEHYIQSLMFEEILLSVTGNDISKKDAENFALVVLDRFRNTYIEHKWLSICLQYSSKMRLRNAAIIATFIHLNKSIPVNMCIGMAAHILFMRSTIGEDGKYYGTLDGMKYFIDDDHAQLYADYWENYATGTMVEKILSDDKLWGNTFSGLPGFTQEVLYWLLLLIEHGVSDVLKQIKGKSPGNNPQVKPI